MNTRGVGFWMVQGPGWVLLMYLTVVQGLSALDYELGVRLGFQDSAAVITEIGTAFWYGFAFGDLVLYIPLLAAGLIGHWRGRPWGDPLLGAALGITAYWPIVVLAAAFTARNASGWNLPNETLYWIALPFIAMWGALGLWYICNHSEKERL